MKKIFLNILVIAVLSVLLGAGFGPGAATTSLPDNSPQWWVSAADNQTTDLPPAKIEKGHPKLDSQLDQLDQLARAEARKEAKDFAQRRGLALSADNEVRVVIEGEPGSVNANKDAVAGVGGRVETSYQGLIQAVVPVARLIALADKPNVKLVRRPFEPFPLTVTSEGVATVNATVWQSANFTGAGVKIAILDGGFKDYTARQNAGELPSSVVVQSFRADGNINGDPVYPSIHGTGVAEIVYDMAPAAILYLVNFATDVEFSSAVDWLIAQGVKIISHSMGWPGSGPGDGTGPINAIVDRARAAGILWVNSAGNWAQRHWQGPFVDTNSNRYHEFGPGVEGNTFTIGTERVVTVILTWDDPWGTSGNDYKLWLFDDVGNSAYSQSIQDGQGGNDYPVEDLSFILLPGNYHVKIEAVNNPQVVNLQLYGIYVDMQYTNPAGSVSVPADSPYALAVGAVAWNSNTLESFSSQGPTTDNRIKPDLVAPDAVSTVSYGAGGFSGTSASAPHVAGAAALVKGAFPSYSPARLQYFLELRAVDLGLPGLPGKDNLYGSGRLSLGTPPAMYGDANGDNKLNAADITELEKIIGGLVTTPPLKADANQDGQYNVLDITKLERFIVGLYEPE